MSQSYTKACRDCGQQIRMAEVNGKWAAYELDGNGYHACKQNQQGQPQVQQSGQGQQLTVDQRLARLERAVFRNAD